MSDSYAFHFVTGESAIAGRYAGAKRVFPEPYPTSAIAIKDYLTKMPDMNAMRSGLHMLQCALSRQCKPSDTYWEGEGLAQINSKEIGGSGPGISYWRKRE